MKFLIVGLGNIGPEYDQTRHNIGFDLADSLAIKLGESFKLDRHAWVCSGRIKNREFRIIKPTTYMNLSGKAVRYWMDAEKIPIERILVLVDDLALPLGCIRLRPGGSAAGHNGLKNIEELLGTSQYPRLRFGIGNGFAKGKQVDFVLGKWKPSELPLILEKIPRGLEIIESFAFQGLPKTMSLFNE